MSQLNENGTELICKEQSIPEFPNLLFGTEIETGRVFFDATEYLQKHNLNKNIKDFFVKYEAQIEALSESYGVSYSSVFKINNNGHYLIDGNFTYLFIAFVEPHFLGYMCDRIHDLFNNGVVVSDTYLLKTARERLSPEVIMGNIDERK